MFNRGHQDQLHSAILNMINTVVPLTAPVMGSAGGGISIATLLETLQWP